MLNLRACAAVVVLTCLAHAGAHADVALDAAGWMALAPSTDTRTIYVSASVGNDGNSCLVLTSPCKTIAKGVSLLRSGFPDWLLLKKGDTWKNEVFGTIAKNGRSASEPILIGAYGAGPRPKIETSGASTSAVLATQSGSNNSTGHFIAISGLEFYCFDRNPDDVRFNPTSAAQEPIAINWQNGAKWALFEDLKISFYSVAMNLQPYDGVNPTVATIKHLNLQLRRSLIVDNYGLTSSGVFLDGFESATLVENLFDKNGYNEKISGHTLYDHRNDFATNHGLYVNGQFANIGYVNGPVTMTGNMYMRDIRGAHLRSGGFVENNLFVQDTYAFDFGRPRADVSYSITNNVLLEQVDVPGLTNPTGGPATGGSIGIFQTYNQFPTNFSAGSIAATGNIFANTKATNYNGYAFAVQGAGVVRLTGNIMYEWNYGPGDAEHGPLKLNGASGSVTSTPNEIYLSAEATYNTVSPSKYPAPTRSVGTYAGTLGLTATLDSFLLAVRGQSKEMWDTRLTTNSVNNYIRAGFGVGVITPPTPDTIAPSIPTGLNANAVSNSQANLIWNSASDNIGVTGYSVFRNGLKIASVTTTSYQDRAYATGANYSVSAYDAAGNSSAKSVVVSVVFNASAPLPPTGSGSSGSSGNSPSPSAPIASGAPPFQAPISGAPAPLLPSVPSVGNTSGGYLNPSPRPSVKIYSPANGLLIKGNTAVNIAAQGTGQSITIMADGQVIEMCSRVGVCSAIWPAKNIARGTHIIRAVVTDSHGLQSTDSVLVISLK